MTTGNRNYQRRVFDLTYEKREPAGDFVQFNSLLDEAGATLLDEAGDILIDEGTHFLGINSENEGMHYIKRVFDLTYSVRDHE